MADVAAHMDNLPLRCQQLGDDGGRGGLSVRAGHRQNGAGADLKKSLHLRSDHAAAGHGRRQLRHIRPQAGGAEDHVLMEIRQITAAQPQLAALRRQRLSQLAQIFLFVPCGDVNAPLQQFFNQRPVGNPHTDDADCFSLKRCQIFFKAHRIAP